MKSIIGHVNRLGFWIVLILMVLGVFWFFSGESELNIDIEEVVMGDVVEEVSGTARVTADEDVRLSFELPGTVREVLFDEGDHVEAGQVMARLDTGLRQTEVNSAEANLRSARARLEEIRSGLTTADMEAAESRVRSARTSLENAKGSLEDVKEIEDLKIKNARESLLTNDLRARLVSDERQNLYSYEPPVISGSFKGSEKGEYRLTLYRSQSDSGYSFRYETELERFGTGRVSTVVPQPLGSKGLYVTFPPNFARDWDIEWLVEIPNQNSPQYSTLNQAYESAKEGRDRTVREAERRVREAEAAYEAAKADFQAATAGTRSEQIEAQEAAVEQAEAALRASEANLAKTVLRAPISGTVDTKTVSVGETVSPGSPVFSLTGSGEPHLEIYIPEVDVANLSVGDRASVSLDAFPREDFEAEVVHISGIAGDREGVATFKTKLQFRDIDERVRVGMTADVDIVTSERSDVIAVPGRALVQRNGKTYVRMLEGDILLYREVERGLRGSDGRVEIVSGLEAGERIVTYADESDLASLEVKYDDR